MTESRLPLAEALADRYAIERELGRGGMATVYLAHDLKHDRPVALKVLSPDLASALGAERFQREIRLAARLQHAHILTVHDSGEAAGRLWFTMPYVDGESLRDRLKRERQLTVEEAVRIGRDAALALDYAHRHAVVHRDIKPENILLTAEGQVLVADFGVARAVQGEDEALTQTGLAVGTPTYMSPEQAAGDRQVDGRSDLYSLGCVVYEMLAGEPPYTGPSPQAVLARRLTEQVRPLRSTRDAVPPPVEAAVMRALARAPADRFATAAEFRRALEARDMVVPQPLRRRRGVVVVAALAIATALVLGAAWVALRPGAAPPVAARSAIAILPFAVRGNPALGYLGEGMVELLSTKLDRAGDLRAVDPRALLSAVRDRRAELGPDDARAVAQRFGAARYVLGSVLQLGDSVRLSAALYDSAGVVQASAESVGRETELGRAVDEVARLLIGRMSNTPADRLESIGAVTTTSFPALRAYLDGQQAFRAGQLDSAVVAFRRATELDTVFALAWYRLATAAVWNNQDSLWYKAMDQAVRHEKRLSPHDRALLEAQHAWRQGRLIEAERRYSAITSAHPDDQEAWFWLGDVRWHTNFLNGRGVSEAEPALRRALALDPGDWQARGHLEWLLRRTERPAAADSVDSPPDTTSLSYVFLRRDVPDTAERRAAIYRLATPEQLYFMAVLLLQPGYNPAVGLRLARMLTEPSRPPEWRAQGHLILGCEQLARGRWEDADLEFGKAEQLLPDYALPYRVLFALGSPVPVPDSTLLALAQRLKAWDAAGMPDRHPDGAVPEFNKMSLASAFYSDRVIIRRFLVAMLDLRLGNAKAAIEQASALGAQPDSDSLGSLTRDYSATITASLAAAKRDPAAVLKALETQRFIVLGYRFIYPFHSHGVARLLRASALAQTGREDEALGWLDGLMTPESSVLDRQFLRAPAYRMAGEIHDRRGDRQAALEAYGRFVELWRDGDPAALEQVKAVQERMGVLAPEPRT